VGKPEGKRPLRRPRCKWVDNIKMNLRERGWDGMNDQWRVLVNKVNEPSVSIKCWEFLEGLHNWQLLKKGSAP
jgi:hypothetical protein